MTIRDTMAIICNTMRSPQLAMDTDFMIISWRIIAVWVRLDKFQVVCHEQELLIFGSDRLDATMTSAEYTQSIFVACWRHPRPILPNRLGIVGSGASSTVWRTLSLRITHLHSSQPPPRLALGRLALTPEHMLEVARHGALITVIKVLEACMDQPETIAVVCGFVASLLSMPDVNIEGLNFRYTEALTALVEKHPNHFNLKCMVSGCYMQVAETYKFIQFVQKWMTTKEACDCLRNCASNTDISRIQRLHMTLMALGVLAVQSRKDDKALDYLMEDDCSIGEVIIT